eukprot:TRINITY_DN60345_c0_g1_i1.p3 TRINITY_DN60345_c0_g1~~TRINITY_DN60345_c0_g1_i1.p3  ORF type:complete len:100 (+),score=1.94 TRINITY_DN60345_c0_g1_i1:137-436(+)
MPCRVILIDYNNPSLCDYNSIFLKGKNNKKQIEHMSTYVRKHATQRQQNFLLAKRNYLKKSIFQSVAGNSIPQNISKKKYKYFNYIKIFQKLYQTHVYK